MPGLTLALTRAAALAAAAVVALTGAADAAKLNASPSITLDGAWNSNVRNVPQNETSDYFVRVHPAVALALVTQAATVSVSGGFDAEWYAEQEDLNRTTATKDINLTATAPVQISPRLTVLPGARFVETRDAVRRNELTATPIPGLPPSETLVTARTTVREYSGTMQFGYSVTPNLELGVGGGGLRREYPEHPPGLFGARTFTGNLSVSYRLTPIFSAGIFGDTSYDSYDGRPNSRTYTGGMKGNYTITGRVTAEGRAGATLLRESTGVGDERREEWSPYGRLSVTYASGDLRATLAGSYQMAGGGSFGRTTKRQNATANLADRFSPRWTWTLSGSIQSDRSTDPAVTEDTVTGEGAAGVRYQVTRWASLHVDGNVFRQRARGLVGTDTSRQSVLVGVTLSDNYNIF